MNNDSISFSNTDGVFGSLEGEESKRVKGGRKGEGRRQKGTPSPCLDAFKIKGRGEWISIPFLWMLSGEEKGVT